MQAPSLVQDMQPIATQRGPVSTGCNGYMHSRARRSARSPEVPWQHAVELDLACRPMHLQRSTASQQLCRVMKVIKIDMAC